jgi:hypothetical protein
MNAEHHSRMNRRVAIKWMLTVAASAALADEQLFGATEETPAHRAIGYGTDPDLVKTYKPGDLWSLTFTDDQRRTAVALCDTILPDDGKSPAASGVAIHSGRARSMAERAGDQWRGPQSCAGATPRDAQACPAVWGSASSARDRQQRRGLPLSWVRCLSPPC